MERLIARTPESLSVPVRYAVTATIMLVCAGLQAGLRAQSGFIGLFILLPGVFLSGFLFDRGTALFAALGAILFAAFTTIPGHDVAEYSAPIALFTVTALGVAFVAEALRSEMHKVVRSERAKTILLQELAHRTRNNLTILGALIQLQAKADTPAIAERLEAAAQRVQVLAEVYDHLTLRADAKLVDFRDYLSKLCEKLRTILTAPAPVALTCEVDEAYIPSEQAVPLAIIMNELVTNAFKYAFPHPARAGHIHVAFRAERCLELTVTDNGIGFDGVAERSGLGTRIVHLLTQQLGGTLVYEKLDPGTCVRLRVPRGDR